jgi:hypothetical protein
MVTETLNDPVSGSKKIASVVLGDGSTYDFLELSGGVNYLPYPAGKHFFGLVRNGDGSWDFTWANTNSHYHFALVGEQLVGATSLCLISGFALPKEVLPLHHNAILFGFN